MNLYPWIVLLHVVGAFLFVLGHGASAMAAIRMREERDPARIAALLDLSGASLGMMYGGILVLLIGGVWAAFAGGWWGHLWIWLAIGLLVVITGAMYPLGSQYYGRVRNAVGLKKYNDPKDAPAPTPTAPAELDALLSSPRPFQLAAIGGVGLLLILWLMIVKPF
jgi:Predicted integral membrane protein (DUF2269)